MPVEQSGANTTAEIHGNFNDVRGDQFNLVVHENVTLDPEQTRRGLGANMEITTKGTIKLIQEIASVVPIDLVKSILIDIATILSLLQKHTKNNDSLSVLTHGCKTICATLALSAKGLSMGRVSGIYWNALRALHSSVNNLRLRVKNLLKRGCVWKLCRTRLDVKEITAWSTELDRAFMSFSNRLNLVTVIPLEQTYELLQQPDVLNLIPDPPPQPPVIFFGREELLRDVNAVLLRDGHVTLIGPGGIGKSTLAIAVMNDEGIIKHYRRRFFVTYSGMNPRTITFASFLDRIASVLGLQISDTEGERQIKTNLGLSTVLVVLDNAETFEDAVHRDEATQISDFIAHIANTPGVTVVLTSRTSGSARRVFWVRFEVPPLDKEPARLSFRSIYDSKISDEGVNKLLAAIDFHPLMISILAYTAKENRWSGRVLLDRWNSQRSELLQTGDGKDNLAFTINLSLESPSVKEHGDDVMRVLRIITFFPQGINQDHLTHLFPSVPRISSIMDTLCKVSLIYVTAPFLTMLAPIRLFIETLSTASTELLGDINRMYYSSLEAISEEKDSHADLLVSDHLNIEHLIAFDIVHPPPDVTIIISATREFLLGLRWHKPRSTLLSTVVSSLPEETTVEKESKAWCLDALGDLYFDLSSFSSASTASSAAHALFIATGEHAMAAGCASTMALSQTTRGNYSRAQQFLESFICSSSWQHIDEEIKAEIYFALDSSRMHSSEGTDGLFLRSMNDSWRGLQSRVRHYQARMYHGHSTPEEVERQLKPLQSDYMSSSRRWNRWRFLDALAEAAYLQRRFDAAYQLLDQAQESVKGSFSLTMIILTFKAAVATEKGDYDLSRSLSQRCINTLTVVATSSSHDYLRIIYVQGRNELYAGNLSTARRFLVNTIVHCDACDDIATKALCLRALGEVELLLGQTTGSSRYFSQTAELCKEAGAPPGLLAVCDPMFRVDDNKFPGWKTFLALHHVG